MDTNFKFKLTLISYPFSHREMHSIQTHTEKGHGHETQKPAAATPDKGTPAPSLGVRELKPWSFCNFDMVSG